MFGLSRQSIVSQGTVEVACGTMIATCTGGLNAESRLVPWLRWQVIDPPPPPLLLREIIDIECFTSVSSMVQLHIQVDD